MNTAAKIIAHLRTLRSPRDAGGQRRYGIVPKGEHLGIRAPVLREIARRHRRNHALALELWETGVHEARVLAALKDVFGIESINKVHITLRNITINEPLPKIEKIEFSAGV